MILLDAFSGYGGFHLGLEQAGFNFTKTYFSEIDKHAIANYRYNFPNAEYLGAVENVLARGIKADIVTFGSPCQDFSLAGKRAGLDGSRSSLIEHAIEYIRRVRPRVFIWENVKGVFSSNGGADFWAIIQAFTNIGGYELQWGLVNTIQWLPQNRERIFLVGLAGGLGAGEIFPLGESDAGVDESQGESQGEGQRVRGNHSRTISNRYGKDGSECLIKYGTSQDQVKIVGELNSSQDGKVFDPSGAVQCLSAGHGNMPKIMQRSRGNNKGCEHDDCPTISSNSFEHNNHVVKRAPLKFQQRNQKNIEGDYAFTIDSVNTGCVDVGGSIRRLTPTECSRLQGLPDSWLKYGNYDGEVKIISDSQQYKMAGNGVSIPPVKAIAEKLLPLFTPLPS